MARFLVLTETDDAGLPALLKTTGVVAAYRAPTVFCEGNHSGGKLSESFTKGLKYGWWVCRTCMKPKRLYWTNVFADTSFGRNLLAEELAKITPVLKTSEEKRAFSEAWDAKVEAGWERAGLNKNGNSK